MAQWLKRRPVRRFASFCMTACSSTSVCRLPFISACTSPAPAAIAAFSAESSGPSVATMRQLERSSFAAAAICRISLLRPEQHRHDQPGLGRLHRTGERLGAARVHHAGEHRLEPAAALQQPLQPMLRHIAPHAASWAPTTSIVAVATCFPVGSVHDAVENHQPLVRPLLPHHYLRRQDGIDRQCGQYLHRGRADRRSGSRQLRPDQRGQDGRDDPGRALRVGGVGKQADIAEGGAPGAYITRLQGALQRCGIAEPDLVERLVLHRRHA